MNYEEFKERVFDNKYDVPISVCDEIEKWYGESRDTVEKNVFCAMLFGFGLKKADFAVRFAIQKSFRDDEKNKRRFPVAIPSGLDLREIEVEYSVEDVLAGEDEKKIEAAKKEARRQIRIVFPRRKQQN